MAQALTSLFFSGVLSDIPLYDENIIDTPLNRLPYAVEAPMIYITSNMNLHTYLKPALTFCVRYIVVVNRMTGLADSGKTIVSWTVVHTSNGQKHLRASSFFW